MSRLKIIAGNWKMNCNLSESEKLLKALVNNVKPKNGVVPVVCPPFTSLALTASLLKNTPIQLGAQDVSEHDNGAYTGDISAKMLKSIGVQHVIIGHSERRQYHNEDDQLVNSKIRQVLKAGLKPIVCIGESLEQREGNNTEQIIRQQLTGAIVGIAAKGLNDIIIAYEPVWAIGTGRTASPEMAQEVHELIRSELSKLDQALSKKISIIYGGSVKPDNAAGLLSQPDIDGALVGGASLDAKSFISILEAA